MSHSIEQYLLHAALRCGLAPEVNATYRLQLFLVANRDLGSKHHQNDFQRALETAVDAKGLFSNHEGRGSGEYALTRAGPHAATNYLGTVPAVYAPTLKESFKATMRGTVAKTEVRIVTRGTKSTVFFGAERLRSAKEACQRLEVSAGLRLPTQGDSAVRVLQDMAIDRGFEIEFV
jgi:hypothetical protein